MFPERVSAILALDNVDASLDTSVAVERFFARAAQRLSNQSEGQLSEIQAWRRAHARRWVNRQSKRSAMTPDTKSALIVAKALHADAANDISQLSQELGEAIASSFGTASGRRCQLDPTPKR